MGGPVPAGIDVPRQRLRIIADHVVDYLVHRNARYCPGLSARRGYLQIHEPGIAAEAEVKREIILVTLSRAAFHLASQDLPVDADSDLGADGSTIDSCTVSRQVHLEPMVRVSVTHEYLPIGDQVKIAVVVEIRPGRLDRRAEVRQSFLSRHVREVPITVVAIEAGVVTAVQRREEQVQVTVVVVVSQRGRAVGFLPIGPAEFPHQLKCTAGRPWVPEDLRRILIPEGVTEIAYEQIHVPVVVEIAPGRSVRVAIGVALVISSHAARRCDIREVAVPVILVQPIGDQPVVGNVDVLVAVPVIVAGGDSGGRAVIVVVRRTRGEGTALVVPQDSIIVGGDLAPYLVPSDIQIHVAVVIVIRPTGADGYAHWQRGQANKREGRYARGADVPVECRGYRAFNPTVDIKSPVIVVVRPDRTVECGSCHCEAAPRIVFPDCISREEIHVTIAIVISPCRRPILDARRQRSGPVLKTGSNVAARDTENDGHQCEHRRPTPVHAPQQAAARGHCRASFPADQGQAAQTQQRHRRRLGNGRSAWQFLQNALSAHHFQTPAPSLLPQAT